MRLSMRGRYFDAAVMVSLALCGFAAYINTFRAPFFVDDYYNIVNNSHVHMEALTWNQVRGAFLNPNYDIFRPIAYISFALNYWAGGLDVFGYHLVNVIIHILAGIGVYFFVRKTFKLSCSGEGSEIVSYMVAALTALLWLVSPVQTQAVTYIVQRMTSLTALFYVWSCFFYIEGRTSEGTKTKVLVLLSLIFFLLALGTKPIAITLPFAIIFYEVAFFPMPGKVLSGNRGFYLVLFISLSLIVVFLYSLMTRNYLELPFSNIGFAVQERIFTEARITFYYLSILLIPLPSKLALFHDFPLSRGLFNPPTTFVSLLLLTSMAVLAVLRVRKDPFVSFFALWFLIAILPEALYLSIAPMFEHRLYLPSVGFYAIAVCLSFRLFEAAGRRMKTILGILTTMIALTFILNAYSRNMDWRDDVTFWRDSVKKAPLISTPHEGLGMTYINKGWMEEAKREFMTAKKLNPLSYAARLGLGIVYYERGEYYNAFSELNRAVTSLGRAECPGCADIVDDAFYNIAREFLAMGRVMDAKQALRLGLSVNPGNMAIRNELNKIEGRF